MSSEYQDQFHNKILIAIFMLFSVVYVEAELQRLEHPTKADGSFSFLAVGDWGRKGLYNQSAVARQMGIVGEMLDIDFVISTGDNFYKNGLTGVNDPAFDESFSNIYTAPSLQKQWYTVLGNHDYRGDVLAQLSHELTRRDGRWLCLRSYLLRSGFVEFFFVDTTPFLGEHFTNPEDHVYDWRGVLPRETYVKNLLKVIRVQDLDMALRHSTAKWKIVVAHHPIKSAGNPEIALEFRCCTKFYQLEQQTETAHLSKVAGSSSILSATYWYTFSKLHPQQESFLYLVIRKTPSLLFRQHRLGFRQILLRCETPATANVITSLDEI